jgi:hypothetical protein
VNPIPTLNDTQKTELLGRNRLVDELLRDGLEVAAPMRDRGVDLIAYADLTSSVTSFMARPIQMKAAWSRSFVVDKKYLKIADLLFAFVWNVGNPADPVTYALTQEEAMTVADAMGWTKTVSWQGSKGLYSTTAPGKRLLALLEPHRAKPGTWWTKVTCAPAAKS